VVEKVVRAAEITPLPKAPEIVLGVVNWQGRIIPVVNMRARFGLAAREIDLADRLIFARTGKRAVALIADFVDGVIFRSREDITSPERSGCLYARNAFDGPVRSIRRRRIFFLLPETGLRGAHTLAERLRAAVARLHFESDGLSFTVTASFGISELLAGEDSIDNLLERSDQALYEAKRGGRNRVMIWKPT
jgi:hypothetical protein